MASSTFRFEIFDTRCSFDGAKSLPVRPAPCLTHGDGRGAGGTRFRECVVVERCVFRLSTLYIEEMGIFSVDGTTVEDPQKYNYMITWRYLTTPE